MSVWFWLGVFGVAWLALGTLGLALCRSAAMGDRMAARDEWADHLQDVDWDWPQYRDKGAA